MNNHTIASLPAINRLNTKLTNFKCLLPRRERCKQGAKRLKTARKCNEQLVWEMRLISNVYTNSSISKFERKQNSEGTSIHQLGLILSKITLTVIRCLFVFSQIELFTAGGGGGLEPPWFEHFQQRRVIPNHEVTDIAVRLSDKLKLKGRTCFSLESCNGNSGKDHIVMQSAYYNKELSPGKHYVLLIRIAILFILSKCIFVSKESGNQRWKARWFCWKEGICCSLSKGWLSSP